jgi:hypothetical protein
MPDKNLFKQKRPRLSLGAFLFGKKWDYIFFLDVSVAIFILPVSAAALAAESLAKESLVRESVLTVLVAPLQAAKETAIANANTLSLNVFFMLIFLSDYIVLLINTINNKR